MPRRSRAARTFDITRFSAGLARPGMDTRIQSSLAIADGESEYDEEEGVFVDVTLMPSGQKLTARVPANYAGKGFGFYARVHKEDDLLVVLPNGDPAEGAIVVARLWGAADTPPTEAKDDPDEVMLVVEKDKHLRLKTTGKGRVVVSSEDRVTLWAGEDGADGAVLTLDMAPEAKVEVKGLTVKVTPDAIDIDAGGKPCNVNGDSIVLNGGSAKVARVGDATNGHTHSLISGQAGPYPIATLTISTESPTIKEGADKVKA